MDLNNFLDEIMDDIEESEKKQEQEYSNIAESKYTYEPLSPSKPHTLEETMGNALQKSVASKTHRTLIDGLTTAQLKSIEMIIQGYKPLDIAKKLNITRKTLREWREQENYNEMLEKTRKEYTDAYSNYIVSQVPLALQTLVDAMQEAGWRERVSASKTILEYSNIKKTAAGDLEKLKNDISKPTLIVVNSTPPQPNIFDKEIIENEESEDNIIDVDVD